jgi:TolB-like protein/Flp pilus assembly protein TadD
VIQALIIVEDRYWRFLWLLREFPLLRLTLFGGFSAAGADGEEISFKSQKAKALLAYLAMPLGKSRSREEIMALLWSDRGEAQARASLRQVLTRLRKELGEEAMAALNTTDDTVSLDPGNVTLASNIAGEEFLAGFHLHDPAFEEWLRDERLRLEDTPVPEIQRPGPSMPDKPSIAVLPFANMSADPEQGYFAEGLTEDVITQLGRFRSLFVIHSTSSLSYKGETPRVQDVGRELGVAYVARGSVRKVGNRVRIAVALVEAASGRQLWAERYDRDLEDIFAVQDEVTSKVASTLAGHIDDTNRDRAADMRSDDLTAYELVLLGEQAERELTKDGVLRARALFQQALESDPGNARAHASMARTFLDELWSDWSMDRDAAAEQAFTWAQKAAALDALDNRARVNLGVAYYLGKGNFEAAQVQFAKALELNPNDADAYCLQGWCSVFAGKLDEAIACTDQSRRLTPFAMDDCLWVQFTAHYLAERYEEAMSSLARFPDPRASIEVLRAACHAQLGHDDKARQALETFMSQAPEEYTEWPGEDPEGWRRYWTQQLPFQDPRNLEHLLDGFRKAGLPV